jgi:hypothetical protein
MNEKENYPILVRSDGHCVWLFPIKIISSCQLDQDNFPFDRQQCSLIFRSSRYESSQLILEYNEEETEIFSDQYESEFDMLNATTMLYYSNISPNRNDQFNVSIFSVTIMIERKMTFYLNKIILPYFTFYIVTIFTYLLPVEAGEKKSYSTSILISGMIYLKDTSYFVPKTSKIPMLSIYFNLNLIFIFLIIIGSTFVYSVYYLEKMKKPLPLILRRFLVYSKLMYGINFDRDKPITNLTAKLNENILNFENDLISYSSIRDQLKLISEELINIEKELIRQQVLNDKKMNGTSKNSFESRSDSDLGYDALNLLKTIKLVIKDHQNNNEILYNLEEEDDEENKKKSCFRICISNQTDNINEYNKSNTLNTKKYNFKLINTLESLKCIVNAEKNKQKQTNNNNYHNHHHHHHHHHHQLLYNRNNTEVISNSEKCLTLLKDYNSQIKFFLNESNFSREMSTNEHKVDLKCVPSYVYEWKYFAIIIDRILFFSFALIIPICLLWIYLKIH